MVSSLGSLPCAVIELRPLKGAFFMSLVEGGGIEPQSKGLKPRTATCAPPMSSDCTIVHPYIPLIKGKKIHHRKVAVS